MFKTLRRWWSELRATSTLSNPSAWLREALGATDTQSGISVTAESSLRYTAVFACVRVLSESVAALPLHLYQRRGDGRDRASDHPLYRVLHSQPNPLQTSYEWRALSMVHLLLWGNSYQEIIRDDAGNVTELWPIRPDWVNVKADAGRVIYEVYANGGRNVLPSDRVLHLKGLSTDGLMGLSPIAAARQSIGLSLTAERFGAAYFGKGSRVGGVLALKHSVGPETTAAIKASWEDKHSGVDNFHRIAVLSGEATYTPFVVNNQDAQFLETRRFGVEDICRIFRVPPHMVADLSKANYSNVDALDRAFVQHSLTPWLVTQEQAYTTRLLRPGEQAEYFCEHDLKGMLRGDHESRMRSYTLGIASGVYSPNECRQWENLNPREGGDTFLQPTNLAISPWQPPQSQGAQQ